MSDMEARIRELEERMAMVESVTCTGLRKAPPRPATMECGNEWTEDLRKVRSTCIARVYYGADQKWHNTDGSLHSCGR